MELSHELMMEVTTFCQNTMVERPKQMKNGITFELHWSVYKYTFW